MAKHQECLQSVIEQMEPAEKGMLKCFLLHSSKQIKEDTALQTMLNSTKWLEEYGVDVTVDWVSTQLEEIFTEGTGFFDALTGISENYGKQLDVTIQGVLRKALKVSKPIFQESCDSIEGAIQREAWITEQLINSIIINMDENEKKEFVRLIAEEMAKNGIDPSKVTAACAALLHGGLTAARAIMGFGFHKMVAIIANLIVRMLVGRGLPILINAFLQRMVGILYGPIGWIITAVLTLSSIPALVNPRGYDKYVSAVALLGLSRKSQSEEKDEMNKEDC